MKALIIGATGLVGSQTVDLLLKDDRFEKVVVFSRRALNLQNPKLEVHMVDFDQPETWGNLVVGDVLFSAIGTTIKKARTKDNQYRIDYLYQYQTAQNAVSNGVKTMVLVSSVGASEHSKIFYSRMKGELERDVKDLGFDRLVILQPSILDGDRQERRFAEQVSLKIMRVVKFIPVIQKYRPVHARIVAEAMINLSLKNGPAVETVALDKIFLQV